jgi:transposase
VKQIIRVGMDTSKHIFQLHGVDAAEQVVLRKRLGRKQMVDFFAKLPPSVIGMEACGASHHWARVLAQFGHEVKLIAPQHVKPDVLRNKNDGRDAEGVCEAMSRPRMRFVPVKTAEQQAALMLAGLREQMVARRTQLSNTIRGYAAEFGITAAKGLDKIEPLLAQIAQDASVPKIAHDLFAVQGREYAQLQVELKAIEVRLRAWHRSNADSWRLAKIPGIAPIGATALVMKTPDPHAFPSGRHFAAWLGLTPKDHSTGGKTRLGKITRAGDERLRSVLVAGATAVIQQVEAWPWPSIALAGGAAQTQAAKACRCGACQQDCPHRLEADGDGRELRRRAGTFSIGCIRGRPVGRFASPAERSCKRRTDGRIDRSEGRDSPWDPLAEARSCGCLELASRKPSWPAVQTTASTGRTYGCKRSNQTVKKLLCHGGHIRPNMGPGSSPIKSGTGARDDVG